MLQESKYSPNFNSPFRTIHELREQMKEEIKKEVREELKRELLALQQVEYRRHMDRWMRLIPTEAEKKQEFIANIKAQKRVESKLEKEALLLWEQKPSQDRMKRSGWFRWEEDLERRQQYVKKYIDLNFEHHLKKELKVNILI